METFLRCPDVCSWLVQICSHFDSSELLSADSEVRDPSRLTLPYGIALADMLTCLHKTSKTVYELPSQQMVLMKDILVLNFFADLDIG